MRKFLLIFLIAFSCELSNAQSLAEFLEPFLEVPSANMVVHLTNGKAYVIHSTTFKPVISISIGDSTVYNVAVNKTGSRLVLARRGGLQLFDLKQGSLLASSGYPEDYYTESLKFSTDELLEVLLSSQVGDSRFIQWNVLKDTKANPWTEVPKNNLYTHALGYFQKKWGYAYWENNDQWVTIAADAKKGELLTLLHFRYNEDTYKFIRFYFKKGETITSHQEIAIERIENREVYYHHKSDDKFFLSTRTDSVDQFYTVDMSTLRILREKSVSNERTSNYVSQNGSRIYSIHTPSNIVFSDRKETLQVRVLSMESDQVIGQYAPVELFDASEK